VYWHYDDVALAALANEHIPARHKWCAGWIWPHIDKQQAAQLLYGIGTHAHIARVSLERTFNASACTIVFPTVVAASNATGLDESKIEGGAAVGTVFGDATERAFVRSIDEQIFSENANALFWVGVSDFPGGAQWLPVSSE
jgi:hypothetical protein